MKISKHYFVDLIFGFLKTEMFKFTLERDCVFKEALEKSDARHCE